MQFRAVVAGMALVLAACASEPKAPAFVEPNATALVISLDPRVVIPREMLVPESSKSAAEGRSVDIGRIFGEAMIEALGKDRRIQVAAAPPANILRLYVREYGFRAPATAGDSAQLTMSVAGELFEPGGAKLWAGGVSRKYDKASIDAELADPARLALSLKVISEDIASRLRGDLMARHAAYIQRPSVAVARIGSRAAPPPVRVPAPSPPVAEVPAAPAPAPAPAPVVTPAPPPAPIAAPVPVAPPPPPPAPVTTPPPPPAPVAAAPAPPPAPPPAAKAPPAPKAGELSATVAREGVGLRKQPQRHLAPLQTLPTGTTLTLSSRLENEYGIWWYATGSAGKGWILESDVSVQ